MGIPDNCWKANLIVMKVTQPQALDIKNKKFLYGASSSYSEKYLRLMDIYSIICVQFIAVAASCASKNFSC